MTLQAAYATISMGDINVELGRSRTSTISLDAAENGSYGAINTNSTSRPSSNNPAAMSEWYSYNHNASPPFSYNYYGTYYINTCGASYNLYTRSDNGVFYYLDGSYILAEGTWYLFMFEDPPLYLWRSYYISGGSIYDNGDYYSTCSPY